MFLVFRLLKTKNFLERVWLVGFSSESLQAIIYAVTMGGVNFSVVSEGDTTRHTLKKEPREYDRYDLLKDWLNIAKITFTSGVNAASEEYTPKNQIDRCPLCGIALDENGVCSKCL